MTSDQRIAELEERVAALEETIAWLQENGALKMWEEIALTCRLPPIPAKVCALLYSASPGIVTNERAWELWGEATDPHGGLKVAVSRVRKALGKDAVKTVSCIGYQMDTKAKARLRQQMEDRRDI